MTEPTMASLAQRIVAVSYLSGRFRLRSGEYSPHYFDKFQFSADPALLRELAQKLAGRLPAPVDVVAGIELGGVPLATALSLETGAPCAFIRKARKDYGTARLIEGAAVKGRSVCLVEDIVTTGGQIVASAQALRDEGANVTTVLCIVNRGEQANSTLAAEGLELRAVFQIAELRPWMPT